MNYKTPKPAAKPDDKGEAAAPAPAAPAPAEKPKGLEVAAAIAKVGSKVKDDLDEESSTKEPMGGWKGS